LDGSRPEVIEISSADTFLRMRACGDAGGLRGLEFRTSLGEVLSCGRPQAGSCRVFSSRSTYPLRGFQATCENLNPGNRHRGQSLVTRVSSIKAACWTPARQPAPGGAQLPVSGAPLSWRARAMLFTRLHHVPRAACMHAGMLSLAPFCQQVAEAGNIHSAAFTLSPPACAPVHTVYRLQFALLVKGCRVVACPAKCVLCQHSRLGAQAPVSRAL
jgi:hypothetical protein